MIAYLQGGDCILMWDGFLNKLKLYPNVLQDLNEGCTLEEIITVEKNIGVKFPPDLAQIYLENNGQCVDSKGIFKAISGYDKYSRPKLLSLKSVENVWKILSIDCDVFKRRYIPFAADNEKCMDDVLCIDTETGEIILLWVLIYDLFSPIDWQTHSVSRGENLEEFLQRQMELY